MLGEVAQSGLGWVRGSRGGERIPVRGCLQSFSYAEQDMLQVWFRRINYSCSIV